MRTGTLLVIFVALLAVGGWLFADAATFRLVPARPGLPRAGYTKLEERLGTAPRALRFWELGIGIGCVSASMLVLSQVRRRLF